ncbi:hypothetical protein DFP72DRAFT_1057367 [Ephemerocybe angulata]|uniref:Uncharacterized protein n=1 Tax=Ephemerocybe angulata TaxID=980116 RepID=A0A8H6IKA4_9AGAR|nr:hypothetical protein DFP72DRAFT_1057367 [Tulosesus angulatus]
MRPAQLTASLTGDHRGSGAITHSPTCSRPPLLRTTEYRYIPEAQTNPKDSFASGGSAALMTQAASYASRKRPADSPLPIYSPAKLPRVTGYDNRSIVVSFVKGVFGATASPDLPVHSHPKSGNLPTISPRISRNPTPATKQVSMPPPKVLPIKTSSTSLAPVSSSGSPVGPTTVSPFIARKEGRPSEMLNRKRRAKIKARGRPISKDGRRTKSIIFAAPFRL